MSSEPLEKTTQKLFSKTNMKLMVTKQLFYCRDLKNININIIEAYFKDTEKMQHQKGAN